MSNFIKFSSLFCPLITLALLIQTGFTIDPLLHSCSTNENFIQNSPYYKSLNKLIGNLNYLAAANGFALGSLGQNSQNRSFGLALCRGDISSTDCITCLAEASKEIHRQCPYNKQAIIWYDNCLLKYSNNDFFGKIDTQNKFYLSNVKNVSDPLSFNKTTKGLLSQLAVKASVSPKMYAAGGGDLLMEINGSKKVYGMVQCSRDLSSVDCNKCIDGAIEEIPSCCNGKEGGRVVGGSCSVRYEIYPFLSNKFVVFDKKS